MNYRQNKKYYLKVVLTQFYSVSYYMVMVTLLFCLSCSRFESVRDPHTLYVHLSAEPGHLNPITSTEAIASSINTYIYETLLDRDYDTLELKPLLASHWEISPDKLHYRFYLKKNIRWSDGKPFTADDIVYSFHVIKDPAVANAPLKVYYIDVVSVKKISPYIVEFTYSRPYFLALEICGSIPVVPKHIFDDGTDFNTHKNNRHPIGTGPYIFSKWETGKRIELELNPLYWGNKPDIKKVIYKVIPEPSVALQMLKKGELDVMSLRPIQWVRQTDSQHFKESFYRFTYYQPYYSYIGWNAKNPLFNNKNVRKALTMLINRQAILDSLLFGLGTVVTGPFYIYDKYYNHAVQPLPYDPEKAKELLNNAGWVDSDGDGILDSGGKKFSFTFTIASASKFAERLATILKEDFAKVGIQMEINRYEWAVFVNKIDKRDFDAVTLGWSLSWEGDPYQLWHSSQVKAGSNFCYFINREADEIIEKARKEFDVNKRIVLYHRFHEIIHDEQPYTFLYCTPALVAVSKRFTNVIVHKRGLNYAEWKVTGN
jgi:peptide/nickel transport system substrate-binding protein